MDEEFVELKEYAVRYAAIDIGSNAARLLIKQLEDEDEPRFSRVLLFRFPLRLGSEVFSSGYISQRKEKTLVRLMKSFRLLMKVYEVSDYRACATSAMRDAANRYDVIRRVQKKTGVKIEIIDGQEEARLIYNNHIEYMKDRRGNYMYVDVGGGSTEINLLAEGELVCSRSYNIGTVRILNNAVSESEWQRLRNDMKDLALSYPNINLIGSGGNITKLFKLVRKGRSLRSQKMGVEALRELYDKLKSMTVAQRMKEYSLKADRADVIVPAGEIFLTIFNLIGASSIYVPDIGLADGIIDGLYSKHLEEGADEA